MNKKIRRNYKFYNYKRRVRNYIHSFCYFENGDLIYPSVQDVIDENKLLKFKTQSVQCSCYMCSGYYKYKRFEKRAEDKRLIDEWKEETGFEKE